MTCQEIQIPQGYEGVLAGEPADFAQYRCGKCKTVFVASHYASHRMATGRTVTHCGQPAWWIRNVKKKETSPQSIVIVCAASLTASAQCPKDCRKCFFGGEIAVQWSFSGQGYVQYYPNRETIRQEVQIYENLSPRYRQLSLAEQAKQAALTEYLEKHKVDIKCNFCGGELGDVEKQPHDNPMFAEYRTCLKCGHQWAKEYWAWLAKEQGVEA